MMEMQPVVRFGGAGCGRCIPLVLLVLASLGCGQRKILTQKIDALTAQGRTTQALQLVENGLFDGGGVLAHARNSLTVVTRCSCAAA